MSRYYHSYSYPYSAPVVIHHYYHPYGSGGSFSGAFMGSMVGSSLSHGGTMVAPPVVVYDPRPNLIIPCIVIALMLCLVAMAIRLGDEF